MKNTDMLEWMTDLDGRFLSEAERPAVKVTHKRRRYLPALIAAAAAVVCMTAGVSAALSRNTDLLGQWFGSDAADSLSNLPEPKTYENGQVRVTVETELDDGFTHMVMLSAAYPDGTKYNLLESAIGSEIQYADGRWAATEHGASGFGFHHDETGSVNMDYLTCTIDCATIEHDTMYLVLTNYDSDKPCIFDGIRIPLHAEQNTATVTFTAPDGNHFLLSGFEAVTTGKGVNNLDNQPILTFLDGRHMTLNAKSVAELPLKEQADRNQYTYTQFKWIDVDNIAAVTFRGQTYTRN